MPKAPAKVSVECPHCGFKQLEYAAAKSTLCRQCGRHFSVAPTSVAEPRQNPAVELGNAAHSFLRRVEGIWSRPRIAKIACFDCGTVQELNSAATSTICPGCSVHMDLRDYRINSSFSRNLRTHGEIYITSGGDLNSTRVVCRSAIVEGKLRGSLYCVESAEFRSAGKVQGKLTAPRVLIGKRADVQFYRQLEVNSIEIRGRMSGEIIAQSDVTIRSSGALDGNVTARSINIEKGGRFSGQLMIGKKTLEQAELLPDLESGPAPRRRRPRPDLTGLPATT